MVMAGLRQIFVCATPGEGRCGAKGGGELLERFRVEVEGLGLSPTSVLRNACTRRHEEGPVVFVFPDDVWYTRVTPEDVPAIVERHLGRSTPAGPWRATSRVADR
jgi:(2Fe-2S) ferredoxin